MSTIPQQLVVRLWSDAGWCGRWRAARENYGQRRAALRAALAERG